MRKTSEVLSWLLSSRFFLRLSFGPPVLLLLDSACNLVIPPYEIKGIRLNLELNCFLVLSEFTGRPAGPMIVLNMEYGKDFSGAG